MSMSSKSQIAQAKANVGKVGRSIKFPTAKFVIDDYIIIDSKIVYRVTYADSLSEMYQEGEDTEILQNVYAYKNLATGQIYVSTHSMHKPNLDSDYAKSYLETRGIKPPIAFISENETKVVEIIDEKDDNPHIAISNDFDEMVYCMDSGEASELALMLLHAADAMSKERSRRKTHD